MKFSDYLFAIASMCFFILQETSYAQQYQPFPDSNATWVGIYSSSNGTGYWQISLCENSDDTLVNSINYHKIYFQYSSKGVEYAGAFRNDYNGKVLYLPPYVNDSSEYLWYDFTKNTGDTIEDVALNMDISFLGTYDLKVDSVHFLPAGPYNLKCLFLSPLADEPNWYEGRPIVWVEKIGSLAGGLFNNYLCGLNNEFLKCMSIGDTVFYHPEEPSCYYTQGVSLMYDTGICVLPQGNIGIEDDGVSIKKINIYPNPVDDYLIINHLPINKMDVIITDIYGKLILKKVIHSPEGNSVIIDCDFVSGVYVIQLMSKNKQIWKQIIIK